MVDSIGAWTVAIESRAPWSDSLSDHRTLSTADPITPATERMLGLSDALFGIAITFLALDFGSEVPKTSDGVSEYLVGNIPQYLAYVFAFLVVGFQWWKHHWVFRFIKKRTDTLLLLNSTLLAFVALTPFGMQVLGEDIGGPIALSFFAGLMVCIGTMLWVIWEYAVRNRLTIPDLDRRIVLHMRLRLILMPASFLLIMSVAIAAEILQWHHDGLGLLLLLVLLSGIASRRFNAPSVGIIEREIDGDLDDRNPRADRSLLARIRDGSRSERLTVFTDGVFAVAFTIMALRLAPPQSAIRSGAELVEAASANSSALIAYFITFYVLSAQWTRHVRLFDRMLIADTGLLWINLILLMFVAFMPFATDLTTDPGGRTAVLLYLAVLSGTTITLMAMEVYASRRSMAATHQDHRQLVNLRTRRVGVLLILATAATLGMTMPVPEWGLYALILFTILEPVVRKIAPISATP